MPWPLQARPSGLRQTDGAVLPVAQLPAAAAGSVATLDPLINRVVEALGELHAAELADDHADAPEAGGVRPPTATVLFHWDAVRELATEGGHTLSPAGELEGHGPITGELARRILCDAQVTRVVAGPDSMPLDVGRATQKWSPAQRRALVARDGGCRGPHCDRSASWCEIHHVEWWTRDLGHTDVTNGLLLCRHHHDLVHHGGWRLALGPTAQATWTSPTGHVVVTNPAGRLLEHRHRRRARSERPGRT